MPEFRNNSTWALVKAVHGEENDAILLRDRYGDGTLLTLSVPDSRPDLYRLPEAVLSRIRREIPVRGVWLEGPSEISLFIYDNDSVVLYPYVMDGAQRARVFLHVKNGSALVSEPGGKRIEPLYFRDGEAVFELVAIPGKYVLYRIERKENE